MLVVGTTGAILRALGLHHLDGKTSTFAAFWKNLSFQVPVK
jgi:hypothetical protein